MVQPDNQKKNVEAHPNPVLIKAIARAYSWHERLVSGSAKSIRAITTELGINDRYVSHILHCGFLAPDLVELILAGKQAPDINLDKPLTNLPIEWVKQKLLFKIIN